MRALCTSVGWAEYWPHLEGALSSLNCPWAGSEHLTSSPIPEEMGENGHTEMSGWDLETVSPWHPYFQTVLIDDQTLIIELMRCFGTVQSPEIIFIFWIKKYISIICPSLILEALRSLLPIFSEYIFTFPFYWGSGQAEYNVNNINIQIYIWIWAIHIIKLSFCTLYIFYL